LFELIVNVANHHKFFIDKFALSKELFNIQVKEFKFVFDITHELTKVLSKEGFAQLNDTIS
jgi:PAB1-binding protein PBP1